MNRRPVWLGLAAVLAIAAVAVAGRAAFPGDSPERATAAVGGVKLLPPSQGMYLAAFPDFGGSEDQVTAGAIGSYESLTGREVAWAYFSQNWYDGIVFPAAAVQAIHATGAVPFVRLMSRSGYDNCPEQVFSLQRIKNGDFDTQLRQWARDARDSGIPLLAEFGTEVNGDWFCWNAWWNGGPSGGPLFRDAYRHIIDLFRAEGADDVTWFFHVDAQRSPEMPWNRMADYYPGDGYIDWLGISVYGAQAGDEDWQPFREVLEAGYGELAALSPSKPIAVLEFGVTDQYPGESKAAWLNAAFDALESGSFSRIKAISYWHENWENESGGDDSEDCEEDCCDEEDCCEEDCSDVSAAAATYWSWLRLDSSPEAAAAYRARVAAARYVTSAVFTEPPPSPTPTPSRQNRRFMPGLTRQP